MVYMRPSGSQGRKYGLYVYKSVRSGNSVKSVYIGPYKENMHAVGSFRGPFQTLSERLNRNKSQNLPSTDVASITVKSDTQLPPPSASTPGVEIKPTAGFRRPFQTLQDEWLPQTKIAAKEFATGPSIPAQELTPAESNELNNILLFYNKYGYVDNQFVDRVEQLTKKTTPQYRSELARKSPSLGDFLTGRVIAVSKARQDINLGQLQPLLDVDPVNWDSRQISDFEKLKDWFKKPGNFYKEGADISRILQFPPALWTPKDKELYGDLRRKLLVVPTLTPEAVSEYVSRGVDKGSIIAYRRNKRNLDFDLVFTREKERQAAHRKAILEAEKAKRAAEEEEARERAEAEKERQEAEAERQAAEAEAEAEAKAETEAAGAETESKATGAESKSEAGIGAKTEKTRPRPSIFTVGKKAKTKPPKKAKPPKKPKIVLTAAQKEDMAFIKKDLSQFRRGLKSLSDMLTNANATISFEDQQMKEISKALKDAERAKNEVDINKYTKKLTDSQKRFDSAVRKVQQEEGIVDAFKTYINQRESELAEIKAGKRIDVGRKSSKEILEEMRERNRQKSAGKSKGKSK